MIYSIQNPNNTPQVSMKTLTQIQTEARDKFHKTFKWSVDQLVGQEQLQFLDSLISTAYQLGKDASIEYIKKEAGIESDMSPVNDYVIPFKILEQARSV